MGEESAVCRFSYRVVDELLAKLSNKGIEVQGKFKKTPIKQPSYILGMQVL